MCTLNSVLYSIAHIIVFVLLLLTLYCIVYYFSEMTLVVTTLFRYLLRDLVFV